VEAALSATGGVRNLYVTNVPTGSSLLKPGSDAGLQFVHPSYFFPITTREVSTRRLADVVRDAGIEQIDHIKLDVQGGEFEILRGLGDEGGRRLTGVELEIGFPGGYIDQPPFGTLDEYLRSWGLELFDLRLARTHRSKNEDAEHYPRKIFRVPGYSPTLSKRLWEADAIYFRRLKLVLESGSVEQLRSLIALYCAYGFFVEAYFALEEAEKPGFIPHTLATELQKRVVEWHRKSQFCWIESAALRLTRVHGERLWRRLRRFICRPRSARWIESG
jgi:FkbM family methyltransferase